MFTVHAGTRAASDAGRPAVFRPSKRGRLLRSSMRKSARLAACAAVCMTVTGVVSSTAVAKPPAVEDASAIVEWNAIAARTLVGDSTKLPPETILYMGFVQAAVYDAVVGIAGRYEPYQFDERGPRDASLSAAAIAAAHRILVTYSPSAQSALDASYASSLAQIADGDAKTEGVDYGVRAADHLIALRANDGRNADIRFTQPAAPGVWRPTPPANAPMADPWLGQVTPMLVRSAVQFAPDQPPPALTSRRYTEDLAEVRAIGSATSATRTPDQTATALFFSGNAMVQFNAALRDQAALRRLDIVDAARMFAAVDMTTADFIITVWHAKLLYGTWRPITAINLAETDGNPATSPDPSWVPLTATPPYPSFPSGYSAYVGSFTVALEHTLRTKHLHLTLTSTAAAGTRQYDSGAALRQDVVDARVWLGIHYRIDDTVGVRMGQRLANWTTHHYFRPSH
jgi:hypothetical protein